MLTSANQAKINLSRKLRLGGARGVAGSRSARRRQGTNQPGRWPHTPPARTRAPGAQAQPKGRISTIVQPGRHDGKTGPGRPVSVTGHAVDPFPDEVGVAVVTRVLLDHVQVDPADVPGPLGVMAVARHDVIKLPTCHCGARVLYLLPEGLEAAGRVRVLQRLEVLAGLVRVVGEGQAGVRRVGCGTTSAPPRSCAAPGPAATGGTAEPPAP